jgi:hypothetical protein
MEHYETRALWCSGVPSASSGQAPTQACIAGNGFVRSPRDNGRNLLAARRGRPREAPEG